MRYLIIGNGEIDSDELIKEVGLCDVAVQFNACRHADLAARARRKFVFITNTGTPGDTAAPVLAGFLLSPRLSAALGSATIVLARNPLFYRQKMAILRNQGRATHLYFTPDAQVESLLATRYQVQTVSWLEAVLLDLELRRRGMAFSFMPSTGMIGYEWVRLRARARDSVVVLGFQHHGWQYHPWDIEAQLIRPIG